MNFLIPRENEWEGGVLATLQANYKNRMTYLYCKAFWKPAPSKLAILLGGQFSISTISRREFLHTTTASAAAAVSSSDTDSDTTLCDICLTSLRVEKD